MTEPESTLEKLAEAEEDALSTRARLAPTPAQQDRRRGARWRKPDYPPFDVSAPTNP